jgi:hypothetical protein
MYPVLAERSFVSCSFIMLSRLMLCSSTADLSGNYPKENIQHTEHGESLKSIILIAFLHQQNYAKTPQCSIIATLPALLKYYSFH